MSVWTPLPRGEKICLCYRSSSACDEQTRLLACPSKTVLIFSCALDGFLRGEQRGGRIAAAAAVVCGLGRPGGGNAPVLSLGDGEKTMTTTMTEAGVAKM